jgi:hypothetical protein
MRRLTFPLVQTIGGGTERARLAEDADAGIVEEIAVCDPRVIEIGLISDDEPILAFDIGEEKVLFLQGQWLGFESTYDAPELTGDAYEEFVNGLPEPYSFPCNAFTVLRFPHSGLVLSIRVSGPYLAPEKTVEALRPEYEFRQSEVLDGRLDDIGEVLAREHLSAIS